MINTPQPIVLKDRPVCFVIFGLSGDLAMRMLIPSLKSIAQYNPLHPVTKIIGFARTKFKRADLDKRLKEGIRDYARVTEGDGFSEDDDTFLARLDYIAGDYDDPANYKIIFDELNTKKYEGAIFYLSTPPEIFGVISNQLGSSGVTKIEGVWTRIVVEKPFGVDYESTIQLNNILHSSFPEEDIYRIDHYLAKETVMNIFTFRWGNSIWEPLWNRNYIDHVEILVAEKIDVGTRTGYYDNSSVIRDMIQNHLMQILSIVAMEQPSFMNSKSIRDEKMKVLDAIKDIDVVKDCVVGQYYGYQNHKNIKPNSTTPTLAIFRFFIDNWRWKGTPFYVVSGKCLKEKISVVRMTFKDVPHAMFGRASDLLTSPNVLEIRIQPDESITLTQHVKEPGHGLKTRTIPLTFNYKDHFGANALQGAYERVIIDALNGDQSFFPRSDEIERAWKIVAPMLKDKYNVVQYAPGLDMEHAYLYRNTRQEAEVNRFTNQNEFVVNCAETITRAIRKAIEKKGVCNIAFSGGRTPYPILSLLATDPYISRIDKDKLYIYFVDERCVPPDQAGSNFKMINEAFLRPARMKETNYFRIRGEDPDYKKAAADYQELILKNMGNNPSFDILILGMGNDCHTASLFPGTEAVLDEKSWVIGHFVPQLNAPRITFGRRLINNSKLVMFVISDKEKFENFRQVRKAPYCPQLLPAQVVRPVNGDVIYNVHM